jgi:hypothetical protein
MTPQSKFLERPFLPVQRCERDRRFSISNPFYSNNSGAFNFDSHSVVYSTGDAGADFLLGIPATYLQGSGYYVDVGTWQYYAYAQDHWKATDTLTPAYGVGYDMETPYPVRSWDWPEVSVPAGSWKNRISGRSARPFGSERSHCYDGFAWGTGDADSCPTCPRCGRLQPNAGRVVSTIQRSSVRRDLVIPSAVATCSGA